MSSPILVNFGLGVSPQTYMHIAPGKRRKVGTATHTNLTWEKTSLRGSAEQLELAVARWGSQNWGRRRRVKGCMVGFASCKPLTHLLF